MPLAGQTILPIDTAVAYCKGTAGAVQSIPNNTNTALLFSINDVDTLGIHSTSVSTDQFNIGLKLGWWLICGVYASGGGTTGGTRTARILLNGSPVNGSQDRSPDYLATASAVTTGGFWSCKATTIVQATTSTDYVQVTAFQTSGLAQNTIVSGDLRSALVAVYFGA